MDEENGRASRVRRADILFPEEQLDVAFARPVFLSSYADFGVIHGGLVAGRESGEAGSLRTRVKSVNDRAGLVEQSAYPDLGCVLAKIICNAWAFFDEPVDPTVRSSISSPVRADRTTRSQN